MARTRYWEHRTFEPRSTEVFLDVTEMKSVVVGGRSKHTHVWRVTQKTSLASLSICQAEVPETAAGASTAPDLMATASVAAGP